jgi:hypothetical protein
LFQVLFKSPPLVSNAPLYALWLKIVLIMDALLGIAFVGIGIMYLMSGLQPATRAEVKLLLPNLILFMILGHSSIYICQLVLDLNDAMVDAVIGDGFTSFCPQIPTSSGIMLLILLIVVLIAVIFVAIVLGLRVVIILFTTVLMPIACLCYVFPISRGFAKQIFSMFAMWTFLTFFESIVLVVAFIALVSMSQWVAWLIFVAALIFMFLLPKFLGKAFGTGSSGGGGGVLGIVGLAGTATLAVSGVGAGVAGAAGAMKGGMSAASSAGKGMAGSLASGIARAPMGFAKGAGGAVRQYVLGGNKMRNRMTNPMKTYKQVRDSYSAPESRNTEVGAIRQKYGLSRKGVDS